MAKLAALRGYYDIEIQEHPIPEPMEDGLVIKVEAACICGSDQHFVRMESVPRPGNLGHEFAGRIIAMGPRANDAIHSYGGQLKVGDRIVAYPWITCNRCPSCLTYGEGVCGVCESGFIYGGVFTESEGPLNHDPSRYPYFKGGFGEYVHIFANTFVWKIPEEMPSKIAALLDPCAVAVRAVEQTMTSMGGLNEGLSTTSRALVIGAGPIGIMCGMILKTMGVEQLVISDMLDKKLEMAKEISHADVVVNVSGMSTDERVARINEITQGGPTIVINCANHPSSSIEGMMMVRKLGTYVEVGNAMELGANTHKSELSLANVVFSKNAHITSVVANSAKTFDRAFRLLKRYRELPFEKLITHEFHTLDGLLPHLKMMRDEDYLKAVLTFEESGQ